MFEAFVPRSALLSALLVALAVQSGCARTPPTTTPATNLPASAWADLQKQLLGSFTARRGEGTTITVHYKSISGGSAMLETFASGGYETVTLYHPDGAGLMLTHYCGQGNQARLTAVEASPRRTVFRYLDATNVGPKQGVLRELSVVPTADGFDQITVYRAPDGTDGADTLHFVRDPVAAQ